MDLVFLGVRVGERIRESNSFVFESQASLASWLRGLYRIFSLEDFLSDGWCRQYRLDLLHTDSPSVNRISAGRGRGGRCG